MSYQESHMRQARGICRAFFAALRKKGFTLEDQEELSIARQAITSHSYHVDANRVFQNNIDDLKLLSFLSYIFLRETKSPNITKATEVCVQMILTGALKARGVNFAVGLQKYVTNMLRHEVADNSSVGIGGNGLAAIFTVVSKLSSSSRQPGQ